MRVAFVYDRVNKWGGAERVLLALHKMWPDAPLFTAVYDPVRASWANAFRVHPSVLQRIPFARRMHESLAALTPFAFEQFSFDGYDLVISVTSADAKDLITKPGVTHICYCLTPTRYLWSGFEDYRKRPGLGKGSGIASFGLSLFAPMLKRWDRIAANRPDYFIAISERVASRIRTYYRRDVSAVIYPPMSMPAETSGAIRRKPYFLTVSRLVGYKRVDVIIDAFNRLKLPLVVIGEGHEKRSLMAKAGPTIRFVDGHVSDAMLSDYYLTCRAFVYAADEDFGLAAAEAQSYGTPVIAYRESGIAEIVKDGKSGILFGEQTAESLMRAVRVFSRKRFSPETCRLQAMRMSEKTFSDTMMQKVRELTEKQL